MKFWLSFSVSVSLFRADLNQFGAYPSPIVVPEFKYTADSSGPFSAGHSVPITVNNNTLHTTVPADSSHGTATRMLCVTVLGLCCDCAVTVLCCDCAVTVL